LCEPVHKKFEVVRLVAIRKDVLAQLGKSQVVNLPKLWRTESDRAHQLFRSAQRIYCRSFPEEERESGRVVHGYINDEVAGENHPDSFNYLVAMKAGRVVGMSSFDVLTSGEIPLTFWGYVATAESVRRTGVATELVSAMVAESEAHCASVGSALRSFFLEVEKPDFSSDEMRNVARPAFHHTRSGAGAMIVVDHSGKPHLVYYAQPGMEQTASGRTANRVELLPVVSLVEAGVQVPFDIEPNTVIQSGRLVSGTSGLPVLSAETALGIVKTIMGSYGETYDFAAKQIAAILRSVEKSLDRSRNGSVYVVPILDTRTLEFER